MYVAAGAGDEDEPPLCLVCFRRRLAADATEEAILNALFKATTLVGRDGIVRQAVPIAAVAERLRRSRILPDA